MSLSKNPKSDLKLKYKRMFEISLAISIGLVITAFQVFNVKAKKPVAPPEPPEIITAEDVINTSIKEPPPPPEPPVPVEAPADEILEDIPIESNELLPSVPAQPPAPPEETEDKEPVFIFKPVEEQPEPLGGLQAIQKKIIYPELAKRTGIQGKVFVEAFINKSGIVEKANVIKGIGMGCDSSAVRAVLTTKFKPGKQRGKAVNVRIVLPVTFKLK